MNKWFTTSVQTSAFHRCFPTLKVVDGNRNHSWSPLGDPKTSCPSSKVRTALFYFLLFMVLLKSSHVNWKRYFCIENKKWQSTWNTDWSFSILYRDLRNIFGSMKILQLKLISRNETKPWLCLLVRLFVLTPVWSKGEYSIPLNTHFSSKIRSGNKLFYTRGASFSSLPWSRWSLKPKTPSCLIF